MKRLALSVAIVVFAASTAFSQVIVNSAAYGGLLTNQTELNDEVRKDSGPMAGLYAQVILLNRFQVNDFLYYAWNVNDSTVLGNHFIADAYPLQFGIGSFVLGGGYEFIRLNLDDTSTEYTQNISIPYLRVGQYFNIPGPVRLSLLPWTGVGYQTVSGDGTVTIEIPGPTPNIEQDFTVDESGYLWMNGINLSVSVRRFLDVQAKYGLYYDVEAEEFYNNVTGMVTAYLSRHIGISYRAKYTESTGDNYNLYNMIGLAYSF